MENLCLRESRIYSNHRVEKRTRLSGYGSPRLPTPETSRSSFDGVEGGYNMTETAQRAPIDELSPRTLGVQALPDDAMRLNSSGHLDNRNHPGPRSPPYDSRDDQRPSLPPLKVILGDSMSSPPRTPRIPRESHQPVPQEPIYRVDDYKPAAFYPNKKQRIEPLEPVPPLSAMNASGALPSATFHPPKAGSITSKSPYLTANSEQNVFVTRQEAIDRSYGSHDVRRPTHGSQRAPRGYYNLPAISVRASSSASALDTPQQTPNSARWDRDMAMRRAESEYEAIPVHFGMSRSSTNGDSESYPILSERPDVRHASEHFDRRYAPPPREEFGEHGLVRFGLVEQPSLKQRSEFSHGTYTAPYEYYYAKARKRSNLPKSSTEIMRAWFDENIANPYPTEDQKAVFANATGISLTQVSNWFINHRRRCPELRDKRQERRKM